MEIHGFQKMTVLDYPEHVACTVFTAGCNFRCPFCHNAVLVTDIEDGDAYAEEDVFDYLKKRSGILDGICITGGEPLLQKDISDFIQKCKSLGYRVKLDTNGSFPAKLKELAGAGLLDYVAMDVKNCREKYGMTVGLPHFDTAPIEESVAFLLSGKVPFEFRTTVVEEFHTVEDIVKISEWIAGAPRYFLQNFVDSEHLIGENLHPASKDTLSAMRDAARKNVPPTNLRGLG